MVRLRVVIEARTTQPVQELLHYFQLRSENREVLRLHVDIHGVQVQTVYHCVLDSLGACVLSCYHFWHRGY
jgi:hypothetical protein